MKLWFASLPDDGLPPPLLKGQYVTYGEAGEGDVVSVTVAPDADAPNIAGWLVPAGLGGHAKLLRALASRNDALIMLTVNGLGARALTLAHEVLDGVPSVHVFDARDQDRISYLEQLAWLQAQDRPFAVMASRTEKLVEAVSAGASALFIPPRYDIDFPALARVASAADAKSSRPLSAAEVDHLIGAEASLTVNRHLRKNELLREEDLTVIVAEERGIAPYLSAQIVGSRLRYDVQPGSVLHFGHLMDGEDT